MKCRQFGLSVLLVLIISISSFGADAVPDISKQDNSAPVLNGIKTTEGKVPAVVKVNEAPPVFGKDVSVTESSGVVSAPAVTKANKDTEEKIKGKVARYLKKAIEAYDNGSLNDADDLAVAGIGIDAENEDLIKLKSRINRVQAERTKIAGQITQYASHSFDGGNFLEALIEVRKAVLIDPGNSNASSLFMAIAEKIENDSNIWNVKDKLSIKKVVKYVLQEKYAAAARILRKLEMYYPQAGNYLDVVRVHMVDAENQRRSYAYCDDAQGFFAARRYREAEENVTLALAIEDSNVRALILREQIRIATENGAQKG